jgi:epoxyqueuosine reductase
MTPATRLKLTNKFKQKAELLGFSACGIARARFLEEEAPLLEQWLYNRRQGEMGYLANHFDKRLDPRKLVDGAKSVISLIFNYFPAENINNSGNYKIATYSYGRDYHKVVKKKLVELMKFLKEEAGEIHGRVFVDSAPVMERAWARNAGLGWIGKNSLLLNRKMGSFYFLAELIVDIELEFDNPYPDDFCGTCTRCVDACPTDAIFQPYQVDASRCISYFTIELKSAQIPYPEPEHFQDWIFGCDICQDVCPWNRFSKPHSEPDFKPKDELKAMDKQAWNDITEEVFRELFAGSAIKRAKYEGLKRNIRYVQKKARSETGSE